MFVLPSFDVETENAKIVEEHQLHADVLQTGVRVADSNFVPTQVTTKSSQGGGGLTSFPLP